MHVPSPFAPSRGAALDRLNRFVPNAARDYASGRNTDNGPGAPTAVSALSPYVRYRIVTERELVAAALDRHSLSAAEKFVQEVLWRTYWKGWLELRPQVWTRFLTERDHQAARVPARTLAAAEAGETGIDGFDDWARQLVETGWMHNHARMWFASIWIFTLRLPWALGADFFMRHLIDADAASNTLSWRWVAGLQTVGKTYLATADNIARYTGGRFAPKGLAREAVALTEEPVGAPQPLREGGRLDPKKPWLRLVTHEDFSPETALPDNARPAATLTVADPALLWGDKARAFVDAAAAEVGVRGSGRLCATLDAATLIAAARAAGAAQIATPYAPIGPVATALAALRLKLAAEGIVLVEVRRDWDSDFWPHAKKGFFAFKEQIPRLLRADGLA